jgi:hypothetical protein
MLDPSDSLRLLVEPVDQRLRPVREHNAHAPALPVLHWDGPECHFGLGIRHYESMGRKQPERQNEITSPFPKAAIRSYHNRDMIVRLIPVLGYTDSRRGVRRPRRLRAGASGPSQSGNGPPGLDRHGRRAVRLIRKWLNAGVSDERQGTATGAGSRKARCFAQGVRSFWLRRRSALSQSLPTR